MLIQVRFDDSNYITFNCTFSRPSDSAFVSGPELTAAVVSDSKLSKLSEAEVHHILGELVDYFSRHQGMPEQPSDWYDEWLQQTRQTDGE